MHDKFLGLIGFELFPVASTSSVSRLHFYRCPDYGAKGEHVFFQGCWVALRLDLLQWFMPLPDSAAATGDGDVAVDEGDEEYTEQIERSPVADVPHASAAAPASGSIATAGAAEHEHASIVELVTAVSASADVHGFALAMWRGADNRDGFVLDIGRLVVL